jgi:LEA14-like dessication related protein
MIKKRYLVFIGLVIVILIAAISILQIMADAAAINDLKIHVEDVRLTDIGLTSCDLLVTINFTNPTNRDLSIVSATFDVFIADSYVGNSSLLQLSIPNKSSRVHVISLTLLYSNIAHAVIQGIKNKNFDIYISGEARGYVFYELFIVSVPFSASSTYS